MYGQICTVPKAMNRARPRASPRPLTVTTHVSLLTKLTPKQVQGVIDALFNVACAELKKHNSFNFVNMVKLKLKPATLAKEGFHPTSKVPIVTRAKHLVIKGRVTRKFKLALANELECCWIR